MSTSTKALNAKSLKVRLAENFRNSLLPIAALLILSVITAYGVNSVRSEPLSWRHRPDPSSMTFSIDLLELDTLLSDPNTVLLDARDSTLYSAGHIPGAVNLPPEDIFLSSGGVDLPIAKLSDKFKTYLSSIATQTWIVAYCSESSPELANRLANTITDTGHKKIVVFVPGFEGWQAAKRPIEPQNP
jgi:rhodanese-related sulfurtransferase